VTMAKKGLVLLLLVCCVAALSLDNSPKYADAMKFAIGACPCENHDNCALIRGVRKEVHALSHGNDWKNFDLSVLTTISVFGPVVDPELTCLAHSKGVRVLMRVHIDLGSALDNEHRDEWITTQIDLISRYRVDGLHVDFDSETLKKDGITTQLANVIQETKRRMYERSGNSRVVVTLPWSPLGLDGRIHSIAPIAMAADAVFVAAEDTRAQIIDRCVASHSGAYQRLRSGLLNYIDLNVPRSKLILGLSWKANDYECENGTLPDAPVCLIKISSSNECSDRLAAKVDLDQILLSNATQTAQGFDPVTQSAYYNYMDGASVRQVWFDNVDTLRAKFDIAVELGIAGVGVTSLLSRHPEMQSALLRSL